MASHFMLSFRDGPTCVHESEEGLQPQCLARIQQRPLNLTAARWWLPFWWLPAFGRQPLVDHRLHRLTDFPAQQKLLRPCFSDLSRSSARARWTGQSE